MGTRNLTIVKSKGKTRVAQYGQWDGYPTGQGETIAKFLSRYNLETFKNKVEALGTWTPEQHEAAIRALGITSQWVTVEESDRIKMKYPEFDRDQGAGILELIMQGVVQRVQLDEEFKNDKLYCEYYYEIDLDNKTVSMNGGEPISFDEWTKVGKMEELEKHEAEKNEE